MALPEHQSQNVHLEAITENYAAYARKAKEDGAGSLCVGSVQTSQNGVHLWKHHSLDKAEIRLSINTRQSRAVIAYETDTHKKRRVDFWR